MTGFFAILDDIAALMDDAAVMTKIAAKKTAGVLGDDLAVGADQASRFSASRELPVLWAITKGSFLNKLIILPFAFLLSAFTPQLIVPILLIGGIYLSFEGVEKIIHTFFHKEDSNHEVYESTNEEELLEVEKAKIKTTIVTDFILSIEIIMIALGTVTEEPLSTQILVVSIIAVIATVGVYGIVALMVRMDDAGCKLIKVSKNKKSVIKTILSTTGGTLIWILPKLIKLLAIVGTIAMLLVGGGMFVHNIHEIHDFFHALPIIVTELVMGLIVGLIAYFILKAFKMIKNKWFH
ncbi:MAG: DUF808 family protein [Flavobacteriaceae bacterium]|nr:DUF808 family protein [Flavobacteriaceae bacterium]